MTGLTRPEPRTGPTASTRATATTVLVADDQASADSPGGMQLKVKRLAALSGLPKLTVRAIPTERLADTARAADGTVVFLQSEGGRDPERRDLVLRCLDAGAHVVELNVFALDASDRPTHPRYVPAFLSRDGYHRHVLRCTAQGRRPRAAALILPNPLLHPVHRRPPRRPDGEIRLLRIGRPDPVKWTSFEIDFATRLARRQPGLRVRLRLVGAPETIRSRAGDGPVNLTVDVQGYSADVENLYAWSDLYLHHSRIGETYGNTILEAVLSAVPVVCALDPSWDCAPLEFLGEGNLTAGPTALLDAPETVLGLVGGAPVCSRDDVGADVFLGRILSAADGSGRLAPAPSPLQALRHMSTTVHRLGGEASSIPAAVARQAARSLWRRVHGQ